MEDCKTLQWEIEELIRRDYLTRFVKGLGQSSGIMDGEGLEPYPPRNRVVVGVVNMITTRPTKNPIDEKE
ncbi:hypothetical protein Nepgr_026980 [Nepenthes gracilis]|uniref:Uncharacterized protein n=1 Tax=Nepenthes gracilis TaxID=150966 RepID=A0AAD3Y0W0_NEPGR|nr:hypothetical protein Nepgr_026980 [Nepenthes gracilis]